VKAEVLVVVASAADAEQTMTGVAAAAEKRVLIAAGLFKAFKDKAERFCTIYIQHMVKVSGFRPKKLKIEAPEEAAEAKNDNLTHF
jgi:hypothetical protein